MSYTPCYELATFDVLPHSWKRGILNNLVETLVMADRAFLREHPQTPPLYKAGVVYVFNHDRWQDIPATLARGNGDCKDLSAWRVAELREAGELSACPDVIVHSSGGTTVYHIRVRRSNGVIEDPSRVLGMP